MSRLSLIVAALVAAFAAAQPAMAASHREAPVISQDPTADLTDVYAFVSYDESNVSRELKDREATLIMNVTPDSGFDHLAFLLGLLLLSQRTRELIKLVSAFTVAHSVTLILAASHLLAPPGAWVEPAIAFTIAYVGFIAWRRQAAGHGVVLAFLFGLIHGFGFAGALAETLGDAAQGPHWLLELLAFNLGIEVFQVSVVLAAVALAARLRTVSWRAGAHTFASLAVFASGLTWLVLRLAESALA